MNKTPSRESERNLDKPLVEAGTQCRKRLWLDYHQPVETELNATRQALSAVGQRLLELARSAFPMGVLIEEDSTTAAAEKTQELLAGDAPVLFGATFQKDGVEVECDILVRHKDGFFDLYEIKSGTKITQRYLNDLALQVHVLQATGAKLRATFLLHQNAQYSHTEDTDFPPMQLLRSSDVTAKVQKQVPHVATRVAAFQKLVAESEAPKHPMGTYCIAPSRCPHFDVCAKGAAENPVYELPEITRQQEGALATDGVTDIGELDADRKGLTYAQKRTVEAVKTGELIVEDFVQEELRECEFPLHFVALATITDALPRFTGQRPWRQTPYAWSAHTLHEDGRVEHASFALADRTDPREAVMKGLGRHVEAGGTIVCWNSDNIESMRALLDDAPAAKPSVRTVLGRPIVDLMQLFETGVFHPELRGHSDLGRSVAALLGDKSGKKQAVQDENDLRELLERTFAPRVRATTKQKVAGQIEESMRWRSEQMLALFRKFAKFEASSDKSEKTRPGPKSPSPAKTLPPIEE